MQAKSIHVWHRVQDSNPGNITWEVRVTCMTTARATPARSSWIVNTQFSHRAAIVISNLTPLFAAAIRNSGDHELTKSFIVPTANLIVLPLSEIIQRSDRNILVIAAIVMVFKSVSYIIIPAMLNLRFSESRVKRHFLQTPCKLNQSTYGIVSRIRTQAISLGRWELHVWPLRAPHLLAVVEL